MNRKFYLKIGLVLAVLAGLSVYGNFRTENVAAQKSKTTPVRAKSLCQGSEQTIWTCTTVKNKLASVCASKDLAEDRGFVQYRFGVPGKIELEFPKARRDSQTAFKYKRYTRPLVTMLTLSFENEGVTYEIHDDDNSEEKPPIRAASIDIGDGVRNPSIVCRQPPAGSLMKLEGIVPRDEEN
jgi:hypothetical protein